MLQSEIENIHYDFAMLHNYSINKEPKKTQDQK